MSRACIAARRTEGTAIWSLPIPGVATRKKKSKQVGSVVVLSLFHLAHAAATRSREQLGLPAPFHLRVGISAISLSSVARSACLSGAHPVAGSASMGLSCARSLVEALQAACGKTKCDLWSSSAELSYDIVPSHKPRWRIFCTCMGCSHQPKLREARSDLD